MNLRQMKIYAAVCELQSITKAAEKLYISQPSVSQAVIDIEKHYGIQLFDRISKRLYITDAGRQLYEYTAHILSLCGEMEDRMKNWEQSGSLRIGSSITIGNRIIPALVSEFNKSYPDVQIYVTIDNSDNIEKAVLGGELDFALIEGVVHSDQIVSEKFMDDRLSLVCGKGHPLAAIKHISAAGLTEYDFLSREKGSGTREIVDSSLLVHNIYINPVWESISTQALISAVKSGLGISILPYRLVEPEIDNGSIVSIKIDGIPFERPFYMIHSSNKYLNGAAKQLMQSVRELNGSKSFL